MKIPLDGTIPIDIRAETTCVLAHFLYFARAVSITFDFLGSQCKRNNSRFKFLFLKKKCPERDSNRGSPCRDVALEKYFLHVSLLPWMSEILKYPKSSQKQVQIQTAKTVRTSPISRNF